MGTAAAASRAAAAEHWARFRSLRDERRALRRWEELLSPSERQRMLADIARVALAVGRDLHPDRALDDLDIGRGADSGDTCPRERLAFVAAHWPRLDRALRRIWAAPAQRLTPGTRLALLEQGSVRSTTTAAVLAALRTGDLVQLPPDAPAEPPLARLLGGRLPRRMREQATALTSDTPENRAIKAILVQLIRDLGGIAALAAEGNAADAARQASELREEVRRHLHREPWASLPPSGELAAAMANATTTNPAYRLLFDFWRAYRRAFVFDWTNPLFTLPARETWQIYEAWCLFAVTDALHQLGFRCGAADGFALTRAGLTFSLVKGQAASLRLERDDGRQVMLAYSPTFPRAAAASTPAAETPRSRSHAMRPDIAITIDDSLLVLDAKFKTYAEGDRFAESALLPDIHQMHAYRDAIRRGSAEGVVRAAWLLYAGRRDGEAPAVTAYPPPTAARPFGHGDVGALRLRPGGNHQPLRERITLFLESGR